VIRRAPAATEPAEPGGRPGEPPLGHQERAAEQTIRISIGRVEVRAPTPPAPPAPPTPARLARPSLSLDDYLRQRDEGGRR
jgi:hypothetical protein